MEWMWKSNKYDHSSIKTRGWRCLFKEGVFLKYFGQLDGHFFKGALIWLYNLRIKCNLFQYLLSKQSSLEVLDLNTQLLWTNQLNQNTAPLQRSYIKNNTLNNGNLWMSNCFVSLRQGSTHFIFLNKQGKAQINMLFIFIFRFLYPTLLLICQLTYMSQFLLTNREFIEINPKNTKYW